MKKILLSIITSVSLCSFLGQDFNGYALYNKQNNNTAYLIDKDGNIAKTWNCNVPCNYAVLLKENGNIVRGGEYSGNQLNGAAVGGIVQEINPSGNVVWEYVYSNSDHCAHHDITLIGDNVLLTAWEVKTTNELTQAGYDGASSDKWPTHFIEVAQNGNGGQIVWEWHIWDHLIQDFNSSKDNYGIVANHPELIDINMIAASGGGPGGGGPGGNSGDWFHVNGVDYNSDLDQIAFSSRHASEIYIIDHSTSINEAASHSGGNSGMGGDILYRWGNPSNYGASGSQIVTAAVHDIRWIPDDGRPNGGFLQMFNNSGNNGNSAIDAIDTPKNGFTYNINSGSAYAPSSYTWRHNCIASASGQSSHNRMSNGNTFVNLSGGQGGAGYMYEVDQNDNVVWQYNGGGPAKAFRYECEDLGIINLLNNPCGVDLIEAKKDEIQVFPNPSVGTFTIEGVDKKQPILVLNTKGQIILRKNIFRSNNIDLSNQPNGLYLLKVYLSNGHSITKTISLIK
jgi:hypothetical protein